MGSLHFTSGQGSKEKKKRIAPSDHYLRTARTYQPYQFQPLPRYTYLSSLDSFYWLLS